MVLDFFLSQQPQPLHVVAVADSTGHNHRIEAARLSTPSGKANLETMSRRNGAKLDLKLNLSPPRAGRRVSDESPRRRSPSVSPTSSCVSSEANHQEDQFRYLEGHEENSMMLVGCPRCLMYVMLSEEDPRCPKCKSTVLLDFLHDTATSTTKNNKN